MSYLLASFASVVVISVICVKISYLSTFCLPVGVVCGILIGVVSIALITLIAKGFFKDFCKIK